MALPDNIQPLQFYVQHSGTYRVTQQADETISIGGNDIPSGVPTEIDLSAGDVIIIPMMIGTSIIRLSTGEPVKLEASDSAIPDGAKKSIKSAKKDNEKNA